MSQRCRPLALCIFDWSFSRCLSNPLWREYFLTWRFFIKACLAAVLVPRSRMPIYIRNRFAPTEARSKGVAAVVFTRIAPEYAPHVFIRRLYKTSTEALNCKHPTALRFLCLFLYKKHDRVPRRTPTTSAKDITHKYLINSGSGSDLTESKIYR
jgi:hypothetical protein